MSIFIALEGPDCVGKSTLAKELVAKLAGSGYSVIHCVCPGGTPFGQEIRRVVKGTVGTDRLAEQVMMAADFIELNAKVLSKQEAEIYILDRANFVSGVIYGDAGGMDVAKLKAYCDILKVANLPKMHVLLPMASYEVLKKRREERQGEKCQFEERKEEFHKKVFERYRGFQNNIDDISPFDIMKPYLYSMSYEFIYNCGSHKSIYALNADNPLELVVDDAFTFTGVIRKLSEQKAFY